MVAAIIGGTMSLILAYLVLKDADKTAAVLSGLAKAYASMVQVLQGR